jgi:hypothetical protein
MISSRSDDKTTPLTDGQAHMSSASPSHATALPERPTAAKPRGMGTDALSRSRAHATAFVDVVLAAPAHRVVATVRASREAFRLRPYQSAALALASVAW